MNYDTFEKKLCGIFSKQLKTISAVFPNYDNSFGNENNFKFSLYFDITDEVKLHCKFNVSYGIFFDEEKIRVDFELRAVIDTGRPLLIYSKDGVFCDFLMFNISKNNAEIYIDTIRDIYLNLVIFNISFEEFLIRTESTLLDMLIEKI